MAGLSRARRLGGATGTPSADACRLGRRLFLRIRGLGFRRLCCRLGGLGILAVLFPQALLLLFFLLGQVSLAFLELVVGLGHARSRGGAASLAGCARLNGHEASPRSPVPKPFAASRRRAEEGLIHAHPLQAYSFEITVDFPFRIV